MNRRELLICVCTTVLSASLTAAGMSFGSPKIDNQKPRVLTVSTCDAVTELRSDFNRIELRVLALDDIGKQLRNQGLELSARGSTLESMEARLRSIDFELTEIKTHELFRQ